VTLSLIPLLLLPLVGGYAWFSTWRRTHHYSAREDGHRLYFRAAFYGVCLTIIAALAHILLFVHANGPYQYLVKFVAECLGVPDEIDMWQQPAQAIVLVSTIFWGPALGHIFSLPSRWKKARWLGLKLRLFFSSWDRRVLESAIHRNGGDLERLVLKSQNTSFLPIMVTLQNGKVYVGWPIGNVGPGEDRKTLRLLPMLSGYRDDNHQVKFTTDYWITLAKHRDDQSCLVLKDTIDNAGNSATNEQDS
jgi:hypothetical protein